MFYIISVDLHGYYQGCSDAFKTLNEAKRFLDSKSGLNRCGMICTHKANWIAGCEKPHFGTNFAFGIVKINRKYKKEKDGMDYKFPDEPYDDSESKQKRYNECWEPIERLLKYFQTQRRMLSDWKEWDDESESEREESDPEDSGSYDDDDDEAKEKSADLEHIRKRRKDA